MVSPDGELQAEHGSPVQDDPLALRLPLHQDDPAEGTVIFGAKRSGLPFTEPESELLKSAAHYLAASLSLAERHDEFAYGLDLILDGLERARDAG